MFSWCVDEGREPFSKKQRRTSDALWCSLHAGLLLDTPWMDYMVCDIPRAVFFGVDLAVYVAQIWRIRILGKIWLVCCRAFWECVLCLERPISGLIISYKSLRQWNDAFWQTARSLGAPPTCSQCNPTEVPCRSRTDGLFLLKSRLLRIWYLHSFHFHFLLSLLSAGSLLMWPQWLKPGTWNSISISHAGDKGPKHLSHPLVPPQAHG